MTTDLNLTEDELNRLYQALAIASREIEARIISGFRTTKEDRPQIQDWQNLAGHIINSLKGLHHATTH